MNLDLPSCLHIANYIRYWDGIHAQDAEDFRHDVVVEMIERAKRNGGGLTDKEMWRAARCVRSRYWRAYAKKSLSLNAPIRGMEEPIELQETVADKAAVDLDAWVDARTRLEQLPPGIRRIARKLEKGDPLTRDQQARLVRFRQDGGPKPHDIYLMNHYRDLRSRGLCVMCGEESDGFARCPRCREIFRSYQKRHRQRKGKAWIQTMRAHWRKQGRCYRCGRVSEPGHSKCSYHLDKDREHLRRWKEKRKAVDLDALVDARTRLGQLPLGICRIARKLEKGDPLTRDQQAQLVRFRQDGKPKPHQIYMIHRYRDRRSRGLCVMCGEESDGFVAYCPRCRESQRAYKGRYRQKKGQAWLNTMRAHWIKQGRCSRCGKAPEPGRKRCSYCLAKNREYLRRWRENRARKVRA